MTVVSDRHLGAVDDAGVECGQCMRYFECRGRRDADGAAGRRLATNGTDATLGEKEALDAPRRLERASPRQHDCRKNGSDYRDA